MPADPPPDAVPALPWDALSRSYGRQRWLERSAVATAVEMLHPSVGDRCLDLATGTGEALRALARLDDPPHKVVGVDGSEAMLSRVRALPSGWSLRHGDARALPFDGGVFDVAIASYLLHLLCAADLHLALAELSRVLHPGGRLATVTPAVPVNGLARPLAIRLDRLARRHPDRYGGLRALNPGAALQAAGFRLLTSRWSCRGYPSVCVLAVRQPEPSLARSTP